MPTELCTPWCLQNRASLGANRTEHPLVATEQNIPWQTSYKGQVWTYHCWRGELNHLDNFFQQSPLDPFLWPQFTGQICFAPYIICIWILYLGKKLCPPPPVFSFLPSIIIQYIFNPKSSLLIWDNLWPVPNLFASRCTTIGTRYTAVCNSLCGY